MNAAVETVRAKHFNLSNEVETPSVRAILEHIGEPTRPIAISPARGPPDWEDSPLQIDPHNHPKPPYIQRMVSRARSRFSANHALVALQDAFFSRILASST